MPLTLDYELTQLRSAKRRRTRPHLSMARHLEAEPEDPRWNEGQADPRLEAGCEEPIVTTQSPTTPQAELKISDRDQLIQSIKRGQRPTWIPKPDFHAFHIEQKTSQADKSVQHNFDTPVSPTSTSFQINQDPWFDAWNHANSPHVSPRSPNSPLRTEYFGDEDVAKAATPSLEPLKTSAMDGPASPLSQSPQSLSGDISLPTINKVVSEPHVMPSMAAPRMSRPRAPSLSSSFVMRVPTSPLVNAVTNSSLDFSPTTTLADIPDGNRRDRRMTLPPNSFQSSTPPSIESTPNFSRPLPLAAQASLRRQTTLPHQSHQSHQSHKSLGSFTFHSSPGTQTPPAYLRRCSVALEASPKRRTSMIGSFEESLVRGSMSSPASKPFDFVAQIGVIGKGDCPSNLKCPPHVSAPFQAVFYNYPSSQGSRSIADDAPSPYVGTIDLEHNLKPVVLGAKKRQSVALSLDLGPTTVFASSDPTDPENTPVGKALARDAQLLLQQQQASKSSQRVNLGGAYRVPQQGQLQIMVKNSNNIAVKLYLVPYDLSDMEPGTKTFIRHKSYSSGPIVEGALGNKSHQLDVFDPLKDKHLLRYLIHIKFCCPSKGKFYLYDNIRVVFANRVPDGKEKLRSEVQLPEPKYSPWKPVKSHHRSNQSSINDLSPTSSHFRYASSPHIFDELQHMKLRESKSIPEEAPLAAESTITFHIPDMSGRTPPSSNHIEEHEPPSFAFPDIPAKDELPRQPERALSPVQGFFASTSPRASPVPWGSGSASTVRSFSPAPVEAGNGLLSRQFKGLHNSSVDFGTEPPPSPWAATASLSKILSQNEEPSPSNDTQNVDS